MQWHRDTGNFQNDATGRSLALKVFYYLYDVAENGGATALVPRSHTSDIHPRTLPDEIKQDMPGYVISAGKAGSAVIFEKRTWHSRTVNSQPVEDARRCMTITYMNFWQKIGADMLETADRYDFALIFGCFATVLIQILVHFGAQAGWDGEARE